MCCRKWAKEAYGVVFVSLFNSIRLNKQLDNGMRTRIDTAVCLAANGASEREGQTTVQLISTYENRGLVWRQQSELRHREMRDDNKR